MTGNDGRRPIRRALVSVYNKTGLAELAAGLHEAGVAIVSTGSTAKTIAGEGVPVTPLEELTGFPEVLDGRVKTLHPRVHAGLLADLRKSEHAAALQELGIEGFDLVVVNLYPFSETVASGVDADECVEQIDIGGPSMVRAAAKNHPSVAVVVEPFGYDGVLAAVRAGRVHARGAEDDDVLGLSAHRRIRRRSCELDGCTLAPEEPAHVARLVRRGLETYGVLRYGETRISRRRSTATTQHGRGWRRPSCSTEKRCPTTTSPMPTPPGGPLSSDEQTCVAIIKHATHVGSRSRRCRSPTPTARPTSVTR